MRVSVNPVDCRAHGLCAELLPEWVQLDEWGYPSIDPQHLPEALERAARAAAKTCPVLALRLQ